MPESSPPLLLPLGLATLAVLLLATASVGPAGLGLLAYPLSPSLLNQLRGLEAVSCLVVAPLLLVAATLSRRAHPAAALTAVGPAGYAAYMFAQYVLGPSSRTASPAVLLHLVVFACATACTVAAWSTASRQAWPPVPQRTRRAWTWLLVAMGGFVVLRYVPLFLGAFSSEPIPEEFASEPAFYWSIVLLDLGLVVPAALAAAVAVHRGARTSVPAAYAVVGWFALVPPSVAAMAVVMVWQDDPYASVPTTGLMLAVSAVTSVAAYRMFVRLWHGPRPPTAGSRRGQRAASRTP